MKMSLFSFGAWNFRLSQRSKKLKILDEIKRIMQEIPAMTSLKTEEPPDVQICTVAVVDQGGELFAYYKSVEWMNRVHDWRFFRASAEALEARFGSES